MAHGYWIVQTDIVDSVGHSEYSKANKAVLARYGAEFLVRWGEHEVPEGSARSRQVLIRFPDYETALACYRDPEYAAARRLRADTAEADLVIVAGWDGPPAPP